MGRKSKTIKLLIKLLVKLLEAFKFDSSKSSETKTIKISAWKYGGKLPDISQPMHFAACLRGLRNPVKDFKDHQQ